MLAILHLMAVSWAVPQDPGTPPPAEEIEGAVSNVEIFVFDQGVPAGGVTLVVDGQPVAQSDDTGAIIADIPSGRQKLGLVRGDEFIVELDLLTDKNEVIRVLVTLQDGQEPLLDIESSGSSSPLASERLQEQEGQPQAPLEDQDVPPGALVGTIVSAEDQRPVVNARVFFSGTTIEVRTDRDGAFAAELPADTYSLSVVHPDFDTQTLDNIRVISEREVTANIELTPSGIQLQEYVVTAPYVEGTIAEAIEAQRETSSVVEVLGAEQMAAAGDSDAAQALARVSGLTVEQGKFVLVRGQPYRYTYTLWNGSPLPSPEPLVRVVPLDLFPTGVLSGIEVQKSYSADLPASFGSGLINLQTRGVPEDAFFNVGVSGGGNSITRFRGNPDNVTLDEVSSILGGESSRITYSGGALDFLGFDDGTRALPEEVEAANAEFGDLSGLDRDARDALGRSFLNNYALSAIGYRPDFGLSLAAGGGLKLPGNGRLGAVASAQWSNSWRHQSRVQRNYALSNNVLVARNDVIENRTDLNADVGGILTIQAEWPNHEISTSTFYAHQTQQRAQLATGFLQRSDDGNLRDFLLSWLERQLVAQQARGSHILGPVKLEYRGMVAAADRDAPDRRSYSYIDREPTEGTYAILGDSGVQRDYSTVADRVWSVGADATLTLVNPDKNWLGLQAKAGFAASGQTREAVTRIYTWGPDDERGGDLLETDPEVVYDPALTGLDGTLDFVDQSKSIRDDYEGIYNVTGGYGLLDARLGNIVRLVGGLRYERARLFVNTFQIDPEETPEEERVDNIYDGGFSQCFSSVSDPDPDIELENRRQRAANCALYPSASATVFLGKTVQLRLAYGRTTSRPNLNELSDSRFVDPDTGEAFVGSVNLLPATINGGDVRLEWYPSTTESVTLGAFVKDYTNPIERTFQQVGGTDAFPTFQNAASARVLGVEVGGRLDFGDFYVVGNFAYLNSRVTLATVGVDTNSTRPLDGQAQYTLNAQAGYSGDRHDVTVALNVVGRRLHRAGIQQQPDVFLQPLEGLNAVWSWRIWETNRTTGGLRVKVQNILNTRWLWTQELEGQDREVWRDYNRGVTANAGFTLGFR